MKKSNKISCFYILSSLGLLAALIFGGVYGIYISVGLNFVKSTISNVSNIPAEGASNVSFGGSVNFESSMTGVIILSIVLIVLAIFDIVSLVKQIVLFKQFKAVENSKIEHLVERKVRSKGAVIFFAFVVDLLSVIVGVAGIFLNARTFVGNNFSWVLYLIDGLVALFAVVSFVLMCVKLKNLKKTKQDENLELNNKNFDNEDDENVKHVESDDECFVYQTFSDFNIDEFEYILLKLKHLKSSKIISKDEFDYLRQKFFPIEKVEKSDIKDKNN